MSIQLLTKKRGVRSAHSMTSQWIRRYDESVAHLEKHLYVTKLRQFLITLGSTNLPEWTH